MTKNSDKNRDKNRDKQTCRPDAEHTTGPTGGASHGEIPAEIMMTSVTETSSSGATAASSVAVAPTPPAPCVAPDYAVATRRLLHGMVSREMALAPVLTGVGLPADFLARPVAVRGRQYLALLRRVKDVTGDEFFALTRHRCKPGTFDMMARTGLYCQTLQAFIEHCCEFLYLITDDVQLTLVLAGDTATLRIAVTERELDPDLFLAEFWLLHFHRLCSWVTSFMLPLQAVNFSVDEAPGPARLIYYLLKNWRGGAADNSFSFHSKYLRLPIVKTLPELREHLAASDQDRPIWPDDLLTWSARVRGQLRRAFDQRELQLDIRQIALSLATTARSLRRHLLEEGTSYQLLLDELRRDLAIEKLYVQHLPVADVAEQLGFAEPRSFSRAFKQWTGASPRRYQLQQR